MCGLLGSPPKIESMFCIKSSKAEISDNFSSRDFNLGAVSSMYLLYVDI
jgi:hypothetical protein